MHWTRHVHQPFSIGEGHLYNPEQSIRVTNIRVYLVICRELEANGQNWASVETHTVYKLSWIEEELSHCGTSHGFVRMFRP